MKQVTEERIVNHEGAYVPAKDVDQKETTAIAVVPPSPEERALENAKKIELMASMAAEMRPIAQWSKTNPDRLTGYLINIPNNVDLMPTSFIRAHFKAKNFKGRELTDIVNATRLDAAKRRECFFDALFAMYKAANFVGDMAKLNSKSNRLTITMVKPKEVKVTNSLALTNTKIEAENASLKEKLAILEAQLASRKSE